MKRIPRERWLIFEALYKDGWSAADAARMAKTSQWYAVAYLTRRGLVRHGEETRTLNRAGKGAVPPDLTFRTLTPETAYVLGLIYGDGTLAKTGYYVKIFSGDIDVLGHVNKICGGRLPIKPSGPHCWSVGFHCKRICIELMETYGLCADKSWRLKYPSLSDDLQPHFVRGLLDSDGCWYISRTRLNFSYGCVCEAFVQELRKVLRRFLDVSPDRHMDTGKPQSARRRMKFRIAYSHFDALTIGEWIYANAHGLRCERKFNTWKLGAAREMTSISPAGIKVVLHRYQNGEGIRAIAKSVGRDESGLRKLLLRHGVELRSHGYHNHKLTEHERYEIVTRYLAGESATQLAREFHWDVSSLYKFLRKLGFVHSPQPRQQQA